MGVQLGSSRQDSFIIALTSASGVHAVCSAPSKKSPATRHIVLMSLAAALTGQQLARCQSCSMAVQSVAVVPETGLRANRRTEILKLFLTRDHDAEAIARVQLYQQRARHMRIDDVCALDAVLARPHRRRQRVGILLRR